MMQPKVGSFVALAVLLAASPGAAQVVIVDGTVGAEPTCVPCRPCLPGVPCPPCPPPGCVQLEVEPGSRAPTGEVLLAPDDGVVVLAPPRGDVTLYASGSAPGGPSAPAAPPTRGPVAPAPGTLGLGYFGGWDGIDVWSGGGLRFTGHLTDIAFIEAQLGVTSRRWDETRGLIELPLLLGVRLMGPLVSPIARLYATLATGIALRTLTNQPEAPVWGVWPVELGGGLEAGGPLDERFAIGGFVDVRAAMRVPFEREPATIGLAWSAGLAFLWF